MTLFKKITQKIKPKYLITIVTAVVVIAVMLPVSLSVIPFPLKWKVGDIVAQPSNVVYVEGEEDFPYIYKSDANGGFSGEDFKLLIFTDTHLEQDLTSMSSNNYTIEMLKKNIIAEKPDLVIITGDIITGLYTKNRIKGFADMMEAFEVYWAPVLGNHDGEYPSSVKKEDIIKFWSSYKYCLMRKGNTSGYGNYIINIKTSETTISQSLVFMDSGAYMTKAEKKQYKVEGTAYDYIKADQIQWYKDSISKIKETYGENTKSMMFFHIPLPEINDAYEKGVKVYGEKHEECMPSKYNSGMFAAVKEMGSTQAIFNGHDHINDFDHIYEGVHFIYVQKSGYSSYDLYTKGIAKSKDERRQGCNLVTIKGNGEFTNEPKLNTRFN